MAKERGLDPKDILRIGSVLCIICASIAFILSFVNMVTANKIAENEENEKRNAIISLFSSENIEYSSVDGVPESVNEIYKVTESGTMLGYCVSVAPSGFGGALNMMVGTDAQGAVIGVRIVSHSETPGLGSRIEGEGFLSQFIGKTGSDASGEPVDIISGSTISSRAVASGTYAAVAAVEQILTGGTANE